MSINILSPDDRIVIGKGDAFAAHPAVPLEQYLRGLQLHWSCSISRDLLIDQFWQNWQPRLLPSKEKDAETLAGSDLTAFSPLDQCRKRCCDHMWSKPFVHQRFACQSKNRDRLLLTRKHGGRRSQNIFPFLFQRVPISTWIIANQIVFCLVLRVSVSHWSPKIL